MTDAEGRECKCVTRWEGTYRLRDVTDCPIHAVEYCQSVLPADAAGRRAEWATRLLHDLDRTCTCTSEHDYVCAYHEFAETIDAARARAVKERDEKWQPLVEEYRYEFQQQAEETARLQADVDEMRALIAHFLKRDISELGPPTGTDWRQVLAALRAEPEGTG